MTITVYSTTTCPYCSMLKDWLGSKNIPYVNKFVDQDALAMQEMMGISEGHLGVPFTVIAKDDGTIVKIAGFDRLKIEQGLGI